MAAPGFPGADLYRFSCHLGRTSLPPWSSNYARWPRSLATPSMTPRMRNDNRLNVIGLWKADFRSRLGLIDVDEHYAPGIRPKSPFVHAGRRPQVHLAPFRDTAIILAAIRCCVGCLAGHGAVQSRRMPTLTDMGWRSQIDLAPFIATPIKWPCFIHCFPLASRHLRPNIFHANEQITIKDKHL